jgi:hypothetical protein
MGLLTSPRMARRQVSGYVMRGFAYALNIQAYFLTGPLVLLVFLTKHLAPMWVHVVVIGQSTSPSRAIVVYRKFSRLKF